MKLCSKKEELLPSDYDIPYLPTALSVNAPIVGLVPTTTSSATTTINSGDTPPVPTTTSSGVMPDDSRTISNGVIIEEADF